MTATAAFIIGMNAVFGRAGSASRRSSPCSSPIRSSAAAVPVQFLPEPWGQIGQYFVPGAASNLLRSLSYFPDAATAMQWAILAVLDRLPASCSRSSATTATSPTCTCPRSSSSPSGARNRVTGVRPDRRERYGWDAPGRTHVGEADSRGAAHDDVAPRE